MHQFARNIIVLLYKKNHVHKCSPSPLAAPESVASETYFDVISIQFAKPSHLMADIRDFYGCYCSTFV